MPELGLILKARFDADTHTRFAHIAEVRGLHISELLRRAVKLFIDGDQGGPAPVEPDPDQAQPRRVTVWMPAFLCAAAKARASTAGMATSRWVASLVQSNLMRDPVLTTAELAVVEASVAELRAIGRNLNQIARALNESHFQTERVRLDRLAALDASIKGVAESIDILVRSSRNSWKTADVDY